MICHRIFGLSSDCRVNVNVDYGVILLWLFSRMLSIFLKVLFFIFIFVSFGDFSFPTSNKYQTTYKHSFIFDQNFINSLPFSKIKSFISNLLFHLLQNQKMKSYFLKTNKSTIRFISNIFNTCVFDQIIPHLLQILFDKRHFVNKSIVQLPNSLSFSKQ